MQVSLKKVIYKVNLDVGSASQSSTFVYGMLTVSRTNVSVLAGDVVGGVGGAGLVVIVNTTSVEAVTVDGAGGLGGLGAGGEAEGHVICQTHLSQPLARENLLRVDCGCTHEQEGNVCTDHQLDSREYEPWFWQTGGQDLQQN